MRVSTWAEDQTGRCGPQTELSEGGREWSRAEQSGAGRPDKRRKTNEGEAIVWVWKGDSEGSLTRGTARPGRASERGREDKRGRAVVKVWVAQRRRERERERLSVPSAVGWREKVVSTSKPPPQHTHSHPQTLPRSKGEGRGPQAAMRRKQTHKHTRSLHLLGGGAHCGAVE